jgi:hypothetical protein
VIHRDEDAALTCTGALAPVESIYFGEFLNMTFSPAYHLVDLCFALAFVGLAVWLFKSNSQRAKRAAGFALFAVLPLTDVFRNADTTRQASDMLLIAAGVATALGCTLIALDTRAAGSNR